MGQGVMCQLAEPYHRAMLSMPDADSFRQHLRQCSTCREELDWLRACDEEAKLSMMAYGGPVPMHLVALIATFVLLLTLAILTRHA